MHFTKRTNWELGENPLACALKEARAAGADIIDLTESNPTRCGFVYPQAGLLSTLAAPEALSYAPDPKGLLKVRQALSAYYAGKGVGLGADRFILTSATSEAYSFIFRLLMEAGDRVLIPAPSYPLFSYLAGLNDVDVGYYRLALGGQGWSIDVGSLERAIDTRTRAIVLVSPNNPTGSCVSREELERLNALCRKHGLALVCDEVFADYMFGGAPYLSLGGNTGALTFVLGGLSKALALPQMKLSWIAVNGPARDTQEALERLEVMADTYLSVNTPVQHAAALWLGDMAAIRDQVLARVEANYQALCAAVRTMHGISVLPVQGGWYAVLEVEGLVDGEAFALRLLKEQGVFVHPGYFFDFSDDSYIVISLLLPPDRFIRGLAAFQ